MLTGHQSLGSRFGLLSLSFLIKLLLTVQPGLRFFWTLVVRSVNTPGGDYNSRRVGTVGRATTGLSLTTWVNFSFVTSLHLCPLFLPLGTERGRGSNALLDVSQEFPQAQNLTWLLLAPDIIRIFSFFSPVCTRTQQGMSVSSFSQPRNQTLDGTHCQPRMKPALCRARPGWIYMVGVMASLEHLCVIGSLKILL